MSKIFNVLSKILVVLVALFAVLLSSCSFFKFKTSCDILNLPVYRDSNDSNVSLDSNYINGEVVGELKIINNDGWGKKYISIKVPQNLNDSFSYTLPSEQGKTNYVLTWQEGNLLQWKDINSAALGGTGESIQIVEKSDGTSENPKQNTGSTNTSQTGGTATCTNLICNADRSKIALDSDVTGILSLKNGGIGTSLEDPGEDRILFWDESAGKVRWLKIGDNLDIDDRTLNVENSGGDGGEDPIVIVPPSTGYTGEIYTAGNGLYVSGSEVRLGGNLTENTTLSLGAYDMVYDLNGTGNFDIRNDGESAFFVNDLGYVGIGTTAPNYELGVLGTIQGYNFITSSGMPVNDILLEQEVRNLSITAMTGSLGLDMTSNFVVKKAETTFNAGYTYEPSTTTLTNGNVLIAYQDVSSSEYGNFVIYDSAGNLVKSETTFNAGTTYYPSATTLTNGNILIAYQDASSSYYGNFVIYDSLGNQVVSETTFNAGSTNNPSATTLTNGNILIAYGGWSGSSYGGFVIYDSAGNLVKSVTNFNAGWTKLLSATTLTNGNILIAYQDGDSSDYGNFVIYDSSGNLVKSETTFNAGATYSPSATTLSNGNILIAYRDSTPNFFGRFVIYDSSGNLVKSETTFHGSRTSNPSTTTLTNGNILIAFKQDSIPYFGEFVIYDSSGNLVKSGTTFNAGEASYPSATTLTNGNILIAYQDGDSSDYGNFVIYGSSGASFANLVGIGTTNPQEKLDVVGGNIRTDSSLIAGGAVLGYGVGTGVTDRLGGSAKFMTGTGYIYFDRNNSQITMNETTGNLSGHAYSDDLGWLDFGTDENPSGPVNVNLTSGSVTGKAYIISSGSYVDFTNYSSNVSVNLSTGVFAGYAWSEQLGWVDFSDSGVYFSNNTITTYAADQNLFINPEGDGVTFISGNVTIDGTVFANAFSSNSPLRLQTAGIDRIYVDDTYGYVGIGTTDPTANFHVAGTLRFSNFGAGTLTTDASGNVSVSSDERLKDIQGSFDRGLEEILQLDPILYKWNDASGMETETVYAGLSAQNVQSVIPEAVGVSSDGYLTLSDRPILSATINAIKEQQLQIDELRNILIGEGKILESSQSSSSLDIPTTDTGILSQIQTVYEEFKQFIQTLGMTAQTDELGNNYLSIDSDVKMAGDLSVLGDTTTSNLTVTGNIQMGLIAINTEENSIDVLGVSCYNEETGEESEYCTDTINDPSLSTLYLQKSSSGNLNIFNGKLVIEPNGTMKLDGNLEVTGSVNSKSVETETINTEKIILKGTSIEESGTLPDETISEPQIGESVDLTEPCEKGEIKWDDNNIYVCTSSEKWRASPLNDVE